MFASFGDNITPPQQALGWIPEVYADTEDLKASGQRIVYLTNPHSGHLGLFVSASVARLEHRAILESLDEIDALAPGLDEMKIDNPTGDPDCHKPTFSVRFEPRDVADLKAEYPRKAFEKVRGVSEFNELYKTFVSPWVQVMTTPWSAKVLEQMHPMRLSRQMFSAKYNPWMAGIEGLAGQIEAERHALPADHPAIQREREAFSEITQTEAMRKARDAALEQTFSLLFDRSSGQQVTPTSRASGNTSAGGATGRNQ